MPQFWPAALRALKKLGWDRSLCQDGKTRIGVALCYDVWSHEVSAYASNATSDERSRSRAPPPLESSSYFSAFIAVSRASISAIRF
jgi:hypothetical protein